MDSSKIHVVRISELPADHDKVAWKQVSRDICKACEDSECTLAFDFEALSIKSCQSRLQKIVVQSGGLELVLAGCICGVPPSSFRPSITGWEQEWQSYYDEIPFGLGRYCLHHALAAGAEFKVPRPTRLALRGFTSFQGAALSQPSGLEIMKTLVSLVDVPDSNSTVSFAEYALENGFASRIEVLDLRLLTVRVRTIGGERDLGYVGGNRGSSLGDVGTDSLENLLPRLRVVDVGGSVCGNDFPSHPGDTVRVGSVLGSYGARSHIQGGLLPTVSGPCSDVPEVLRAIGLGVETGGVGLDADVPFMQAVVCPSRWRLCGPLSAHSTLGTCSGLPPMDLDFAGLGVAPVLQDTKWAAEIRSKFELAGDDPETKKFTLQQLENCKDVPPELIPVLSAFLDTVTEHTSTSDAPGEERITTLSMAHVDKYSLMRSWYSDHMRSSFAETDGLYRQKLASKADFFKPEVLRLSDMRLTGATVGEHSASLKLALSHARRVDMSLNAGLFLPSLECMSPVYFSIFSQAGVVIRAYLEGELEGSLRTSKKDVAKYQSEATLRVRQRQVDSAEERVQRLRRQYHEAHSSSWGYSGYSSYDDEADSSTEATCSTIMRGALEVSKQDMEAEAKKIALDVQKNAIKRYTKLQSRKGARVLADWYCQYTSELSECVFPMYGILSRMSAVVQLDLGGVVLEPFLLPPLVAGLRRAATLRSINLSGCFDHMLAKQGGELAAARCVLFIARHVPHLREIGLGGRTDTGVVRAVWTEFRRAGGLEGDEWISKDQMYPAALKEAGDPPGSQPGDYPFESSDASKRMDVTRFQALHDKFDLKQLPERPEYGSATWVRAVRDACYAKAEQRMVDQRRTGIYIGDHASRNKAQRVKQGLPAQVPIDGLLPPDRLWRKRRRQEDKAEQAAEAVQAEDAAGAAAGGGGGAAAMEADEDAVEDVPPPAKKRRIRKRQPAAGKAGGKAGSKAKRKAKKGKEDEKEGGKKGSKGKSSSKARVVEIELTDGESDGEATAEKAAEEATAERAAEAAAAASAPGAGDAGDAAFDLGTMDVVMGTAPRAESVQLLVQGRQFVDWRLWDGDGAAGGALPEGVTLATGDSVPRGNFTGDRLRLRIVSAGSMWADTGLLGDRMPQPDRKTGKTPSAYSAPPAKLDKWSGRVSDLAQRLADEHSFGSVGPSPPSRVAVELVLGCFVPESGSGGEGAVAMDGDDDEEEEEEEEAVEAASGAGADDTPPRKKGGTPDQPVESVPFASVFTKQTESSSSAVQALTVDDVTMAVDALRARKVLTLSEGGSNLRLLRPAVLIDADDL